MCRTSWGSAPLSSGQMPGVRHTEIEKRTTGGFCQLTVGACGAICGDLSGLTPLSGPSTEKGRIGSDAGMPGKKGVSGAEFLRHKLHPFQIRFADQPVAIWERLL